MYSKSIDNNNFRNISLNAEAIIDYALGRYATLVCTNRKSHTASSLWFKAEFVAHKSATGKMSCGT